jgi:hypothetical protein
MAASKPTRAEALLQQQGSRIAACYGRAKRKGIPDPALLVFDLQSPAALRFAQVPGRMGEIERLICTAGEVGEVPVMFWAVPRGQAERMFADVGAVQELRAANSDPDMMLVIVMTGDSSVAGLLPTPAEGAPKPRVFPIIV